MNYNETQLLTETATLVKEMHTRLFGNGQPGELAKLGERFNKVEEDIDDLKASKNKAHGVLWTVSGLVSMLGLSEVWHIFIKK